MERSQMELIEMHTQMVENAVSRRVMIVRSRHRGWNAVALPEKAVSSDSSSPGFNVRNMVQELEGNAMAHCDFFFTQANTMFRESAMISNSSERPLLCCRGASVERKCQYNLLFCQF